MKFFCLHSTIKTCVLGLSFLFSLFLQRAYAQYEDQYVSYADFYNGLAPYGQWIQEPTYGYVWAPAVEGDFRPYYTNGKWVMTEYGNLWASEYPWGWAAFHYGRWTYDSYYGWLWIPGNTWAPAWVSWRADNTTFGWAPLAPGTTGEAAANEKCPADWWVFIPQKYIHEDHYYRYWNGPGSNNKYLKNSRPLSNTFDYRGATYITGPGQQQVKQATGGVVQVYRVRDSKSRNMRVHNDEVRIFKPAKINPNIKGSGDDPYPADAVVAPRPLKEPQGVNDDPSREAPFRQEMLNKRNEPHVVPGTGINPTAEPERKPRSGNNPYEWDVNRHVKQDPPPPSPPKPAAKTPAKGTPPAKGKPGNGKPAVPGAPAREGAKPAAAQPPARRGA